MNRRNYAALLDKLMDEERNQVDKLPYPFESLSLLNIVNIASCIDISKGTMNSYDVRVFGLGADANKRDHIFIEFLCYIKFISLMLEQSVVVDNEGNRYVSNNVNLHRSAITTINFLNSIVKKNMPNVTSAKDLLESLGFDPKKSEIEKIALANAINLVYYQLGCKKTAENPLRLEKINKIDMVDLNYLAMKAIEIPKNEEKYASLNDPNQIIYQNHNLIDMKEWLKIVFGPEDIPRTLRPGYSNI